MTLDHKPVFPRLESPRLSLRELTPADRVHLVAMHQDSRISELLIDHQPFEQHRFSAAFINRMMEIYREFEGLGVWAAERRKVLLSKADMENTLVRQLLSDEALERCSQQKKEFIGWFSLMPIPHDPQEIELGSRLLPAVWGTGLAIEGGELLLAHAFNQLQQHQVWAFSHPAHRAVHYCVHKLGFEDSGIRCYAGKTARVYQINRSQWQEWQQVPDMQRKRHAVVACKALYKDKDLESVKMSVSQ